MEDPRLRPAFDGAGEVGRASAAGVASVLPQQTKDTTEAAADARIGKKVIVTVAGAPLRTPEAIVWKAYLGEIFTVSLTNGEWLWIEEKGGWLWEKETTGFDNAVKEFSKRVQTEPTAENLHLRGIAFLAHQQFDKAIADFSESLKKKPESKGPVAFDTWTMIPDAWSSQRADIGISIDEGNRRKRILNIFLSFPSPLDPRSFNLLFRRRRRQPLDD